MKPFGGFLKHFCCFWHNAWKSYNHLWVNSYFSMRQMGIKLVKGKRKIYFVWLFKHAYGLESFMTRILSTIDISRKSRISREKLKLILAFSREMKSARNWPPLNKDLIMTRIVTIILVMLIVLVLVIIKNIMITRIIKKIGLKRASARPNP